MGCGGIERPSSFIVFRFDDLLFINCSVPITLLNSLSVISADICISSCRYESMFLVQSEMHGNIKSAETSISNRQSHS